jgi:cytochrome b561
MASNSPAGYSGTQILLHWIIAALIVFQLLFSEGMEHAYNAWVKGKEIGADNLLSANIHTVVGFTVLALAVLRVIIRVVRGVPDAPAGQSGVKLWIAALTQVFLYAILFVMPITGAMAWFLGYASMAEVHAFAKPLIILAVLVHFGGALMQHYVAKTDVLVRMMKPEVKRVS